MAKDNKYCPLKYNLDAGSDYCIAEDCGWWDYETRMCAMLLMARSLGKIYKYGIGTENKEKKKKRGGCDNPH